jgi:hypothetical protein
MNQLTLKTVKNIWTKSLSVLDNQYVNLTLVIVLILYISKMFENINEVINGLYQYSFIKLLVLLIIVYVADKDTNIAILLGISYVMSLKNMNMEKFFISKKFSDITTTIVAATTTNTCKSVKYLNQALKIYTTINSGLADIIKSINDLNDTDLKNINNILSSLNNNLRIISNTLQGTINKQLKGITCSIPIFSTINDKNIFKVISSTPTKPITFCNITNPETANDNILLSMAFITDNIQTYKNSKDKALGLIVTCMAINNSITNIILNIKTSLIGTCNSIADPNAQAIIKALDTAKKGINLNIKYGNGLVNTYLSKFLPILCSIVNDKTYKTLISNLSTDCKNNIAEQLFLLINPNFNQYTNLTQDQQVSFSKSVNDSVMKEINRTNILDPNAKWLTKCPKNKLNYFGNITNTNKNNRR